MSPEPQKTKIQIKAEPDNCIIIKQPMVRDFSTGGGHGPEPVLIEGDQRIVTTKWQGYPPDKCTMLGKPHVAMPEVMLPRLVGKAQYATRIRFPNMLYCKLVTSPHPRARVKSMDTSAAEKMPGIVYVLKPDNAPKTYPLPVELFFQGEVVAIVAAETEDQAEDAVAAIQVEYEVLPFASNLQQAMGPNAPDLSVKAGDGFGRPRPMVAKTLSQWGDVDKAFAQSDVVKEFTYNFGGAIPVPMQPSGCVAKWDGDRVTIYGMSQGIYPQKMGIARGLGIPLENVHYINKWNGGTFGGARAANEKFLSLDRPHLEGHRPSRQINDAERPGTGPSAGQAANSHQIQSRRHQRRQDSRLPARISRRHRRNASAGARGRRCAPSCISTSCPTGKRLASSIAPIRWRLALPAAIPSRSTNGPGNR